MIVLGGIVTQKPIGGINTNSTSLTAAQQHAELLKQQQELQRQAQQKAAQQQADAAPKKWSVPFK